MLGNLRFIPCDVLPAEVIARHQDLARRRAIPRVGKSPPAGTPLAVVGGAPSVVSRLDRLRAWPGEIWAINQTCIWLASHGIESTLFSVDPSDLIAAWTRGVKKAVLGDTCSPALFDALQGADVRLAELGPDKILASCSTAATAPTIASAYGHTSVTFFGCDSDLGAGTTSHAYRDEAHEISRMRVRIGGEVFMTRPDLMMIAETMAEMIRALPGYLRLDCDGLLPALVEHGEYEITHVSRDIDAQIRREAAE